MAQRIPDADVLLALMGAPHTSDMLTSAVRLAQALLERGATVHLWTCGHATGIAKAALGATKPRNLENWAHGYPSTLALAERLLDAFPEQLTWYSCRFCTEERGSVPLADRIKLRPPFKFAEHVAAARTTLFLGVI
ncbi:hypothetical protein [Streptomyces rubellomurinus]|uniref:DsrE family protein n=2 Tax=Streptomyces TaxID=1883 RepID=A0A0F2TGI2_STRR3|nr:hypothetical protein [Streptomyces rubellomurinus]KJS52823.1 hypothetical protein VM98_29010 [Streptomyces rubellomurinus subsp. indigoferus]KJS62284.1 hypothetical protein VM95_09810 [Streptomyces rubellomurinus]